MQAAWQQPPALERNHMERLLKPTSTLRGVSERNVVSTSSILPPHCRKASISACNWARTRARLAMEWLSSPSLAQLPVCSRLPSSNSLMPVSPSTKTVHQVPRKPLAATPCLERWPPSATSWRLYNPVLLRALFPDNLFFVIFCIQLQAFDFKSTQSKPRHHLMIDTKNEW